MVNIRRQRNGVQGQQHATYFESPAKNWRKTKTKDKGLEFLDKSLGRPANLNTSTWTPWTQRLSSEKF